MRLRLTVQRHGLPPTQILWTVADSPSNDPKLASAATSQSHPHAASGRPSATIAQLLEDINDIVPLESIDWGLEDYAVEVGGYECLHYMPITDVLRDQDQVLIRALQTNDLRVRRVSGRHQISQDGRHLIDGVAFGRPYLKRNSRPEVHIPPRKRPKLDLEDNDDDVDDSIDSVAALLDSEPTRLLIEGPSQQLGQIMNDEDTSDESDEDFDEDGSLEDVEEGDDQEEMDISEELLQLREDLDGGIDSPASAAHSADQEDGFSNRLRTQLRRGNRQVHFYDSLGVTESTDEDVEDASLDVLLRGVKRKQSSSNEITMTAEFEDADEESDCTGSDSSTDSSSDVSSETSDEEDGGEDEDLRQSPTARNDLDETSTDSSDSSDSQMESSSDISDSSSDHSSSTDESTSESDSGLETQDTTVDMPEQIKTTRPSAPPGQGLSRTHKNNNRLRRRRRLKMLKDQGVLPADANFADLDFYDNPETVDANSLQLIGDSAGIDIETRKDALLEQLANAEVEADSIQLATLVTAERNETPMSASAPIKDDSASVIRDSGSMPTSSAKEDSRRSKLDIASTRRLLFGSLGLRAPRNAEEEAKLREKLAGKDRITADASPQISGPGDAAKEDHGNFSSSVDWKSKILVSAVECEKEGITLEPPPFPFVQHWNRKDETTTTTYPEEHNGISKKRTRTHRRFDGSEDPIAQHTEGSFDLAASSEESPDLPHLPDDLSSLKTLELEDALPGTIIVFQELEVSAATGWTPELSSMKTAKIEKVGQDGMIELCLALRDVPVKHREFNVHTGQPIYSKFDIPQEDEEAEDPRFKYLAFENLMNAKLLVAMASHHGNDTHDSTQRVPESFPDGQGTVDLIGESPEVSLTAINGHISQEPSQPGPAISGHDKQGVLANTASREDLVYSQGHSPVAAWARSSDHPPTETPGKQLKKTLDEDLPPSSIYYEPDSPQFNGFSTTPKEESFSSTPSSHVADSEENVSAVDKTMEDDDTIRVHCGTTSVVSESVGQDENILQAALPQEIEVSDGATDEGFAISQSSIHQSRDGSMISDQELPSLEQIASQVQESQRSPPPSKRTQGNSSKRKRAGETLQTSPTPSDSQRSKLRSRSKSSQPSVTIDPTQHNDPMSILSSDGDLADTEAQQVNGSGKMTKDSLLRNRSRLGAGKRRF